MLRFGVRVEEKELSELPLKWRVAYVVMVVLDVRRLAVSVGVMPSGS